MGHDFDDKKYTSGIIWMMQHTHVIVFFDSKFHHPASHRLCVIYVREDNDSNV